MDAINDEGEHFAHIMFVPKEEQTVLLFELLTKQLPTFLAIFEKRLTGKKFLIGDRLTCGDFMLGGLLTSTVANENYSSYYACQHILKSYPAVSAYIDNFKAANKAYFDSRPVCPL